MAIVKTRELKTLSLDALNSKLAELRLELMKDNAQIATGTLPKSPGQIKNNKKNVARILTQIQDKEKEASKAEAKLADNKKEAAKKIEAQEQSSEPQKGKLSEDKK